MFTEKRHLNSSDDDSDQSQRLEKFLWKFCLFFFFFLSEAQMLSLSIVTKCYIVILKVWVCEVCVTNGKSLYGEQQIPKNT